MADMTVRLTSEHYKKDMIALAAYVRPRRNDGDMTVEVVPPDTGSITVRVALDTLYLLGFRNDAGNWFYFADHQGAHDGTTLVANGSYQSLNVDNFVVQYDQLFNIKGELGNKGAGTGLTTAQKKYLRILLIVICEALRFHHVFWAVSQMLKNQNTYYLIGAHMESITSWHHRSESDHRSVWTPAL